LPEYLAVLAGSPVYLAKVAQSAHSWKRDDLGEICSHPTETSLIASSDLTPLAQCGEPRLRNPLRLIGTVGSARGESRRRHGEPTRARSWKRRTQPRNTYSPLCSPLLGRTNQACWITLRVP